MHPLTIRISAPCGESWATMTPTGGGRHCASCAKTVVDFTQQTDAAILAYFRQVGTGRTCGRFEAGQLGRPLRLPLPAPRPLRWQLWVAGLLVAALSVQSCQTITGEVQPAASRQLLPLPPSAVLSVDSAMIGDVKTLVGDSVVVSAAPDSASQLGKMVLGEPEVQ